MAENRTDKERDDSLEESDYDVENGGSALWEDPRGPEKDTGTENSIHSSQSETLTGITKFLVERLDDYKKMFFGADYEHKQTAAKDQNSSEAARTFEAGEKNSLRKTEQKSDEKTGSGLQEIVQAGIGLAALAGVKPAMTAVRALSNLKGSEKNFETLKLDESGAVDEVRTADGSYRFTGKESADGKRSYIKVDERSGEEGKEFNGRVEIKNGKVQISDAETGKTQVYSAKAINYENLVVSNDGKVEHLESGERSYRLIGNDENGKSKYLVSSEADPEGRPFNGSLSVKDGRVTVEDHDAGTTHEYKNAHDNNAGGTSIYEQTRQLTVAATQAIAGEAAARNVDEAFKDPSKIQQWYNDAAQKARDSQKSEDSRSDSKTPPPPSGEAKSPPSTESQAGAAKPASLTEAAVSPAKAIPNPETQAVSSNTQQDLRLNSQPEAPAPRNLATNLDMLPPGSAKPESSMPTDAPGAVNNT
ncbi:MAG: hypothetical protein K2X27_12755, partial [Candidatus Obscuribacterales bacterium]|nr:hypothetical protein [Candidatus Obscuribacterales bacterium]